MILTAKEHCGRAKVKVDGLDVTKYGFWCDTKAGIVRCFEWEGYPNPPAAGAKKINPLRVVEIRGRVDAELTLK